jgi:Protein of unknown function (DUF2793)
MPDDTTILSLPLILPAQAQKHVTHNEALAVLDLIVQLAVINRVLTTAPALPAVGERHIVAAGATGPWAGQSGRIALYTATGWQFTAPLLGWQAHVLAEGATAVFDGVAWKTPAESPLIATQVGVSATPDATNRLSVSSPATLLNHAGAGHQLKLNKAAAGDTASMLFQTGFSGRAEMGTAGTDDFAVKVSADGSAFKTALVAGATSGEVTLPQPVKLGGQATDPGAPVDGTLWLNTTTGQVKLRSAGATVVMGAAVSVADGDRGDITVSGSGTVWAIDPGAVTLTKLADLASGTILGRTTAGTGVPEALTPAGVRGLLNVANGATANAADATLLARANHTGTQLAATISDFAAAVAATAAVTANTAKVSNATHTGDVTGAAALTIAADAVTNAKLANVATATIKGRATPGTGDPEDLTGTQATALLDTFTAGAKGLVPASGGGTTTFLRADGTFAAPGGGGSGDVVGPGSATDNAIARFDTTTGKLLQTSTVLLPDTGEVTLPLVAVPATPAADTLNIFGRKLGGRMLPGICGPSGLDTALQPHLGSNTVSLFLPNGNSLTVNALGFSSSGTGTATAANIMTTNRHTRMKRIEYLVTTAATTAVAGWRSSTTQYSIGAATAGDGGFHAVMIWGPATGVATSTNRAFCGMRDSVAPSDVEPSTITNMVGMGWDAADANIQFMHNDGSGVATKIDLGASFAVPTVDRTSVYRIAMFSPPGTTQLLSYEVTNLVTGAVATGSVTTNIPANNVLITPNLHMSVGGTSSVVGVAVMKVYVETDY